MLNRGCIWRRPSPRFFHASLALLAVVVALAGCGRSVVQPIASPPGGDRAKGKRYESVGEARRSARFQVPKCSGVGYYTQPRENIVYGHYENEDLILISQPATSANRISGPLPQTGAAVMRPFSVNGVVGYGYESTGRVVELEAGAKQFASNRAYVAWTSDDVTVEISSKSGLSFDQLVTLIQGCSTR